MENCRDYIDFVWLIFICYDFGLYIGLFYYFIL